jgi:signal peptidase I
VSLSRLPLLVLAALAVVLPVRTWLGEPIVVVSPSMEPTLRVGTLLILDKLTLGRRPPRRGEIVSLMGPGAEGRGLVKRVIALPGETVEIREKAVFINGKPLTEHYAVFKRAGERLQGDNVGPWVVPERAVFVLGDNRDESNDSASWKDSGGEPIPFVPFSRLEGLVRRLPWA